MGKVIRYFMVLSALLVCCSFSALAAEAQYGDADIQAEGFSRPGSLCDGSRTTAASTDGPAQVTVSREGGIAALYIEFDRIPQPWTLTDPASGDSLACGENGFLHEYVDISALGDSLPEEIVLSFGAGTAIGELYAFSEGELADRIQIWQPPCQ